MNNNLIVSESIEVNASPEKVWLALTTPEIIKDYLYGTETITDWKVDSEIIFQGEYEGKHYRDKGVILENDVEEKLSYSYWSGFSGTEDKPENYSTVTYTLEKKDNDHTVFTWEQKGFPTEEACRHSKSGMKEFMQKVKEVMER